MNEKKYLNWFNKIGYGSGDVAGNVVYAFLSTFMMFYLTDTVGMDVGVVGTLTLGFGMSLCMTDLASILGIQKDVAMVIGIVVGVAGGVLASLAHPIYNAIVKAKRKKLAPEIIRLADELMK